MSTDNPTKPRAPCACLDTSPLYLFPHDDVIEIWPVDTADSPLARRLAVLLAEAHRAGQRSAVLSSFGAMLEILLAELPSGAAGRAALWGLARGIKAIASAPPRTPLPLDLFELLHAIEADAHEQPATEAAHLLAGLCLALRDEHIVPVPPEDTWHVAVALLHAIADAAGDAAEPTIARCAELAYRALFVRDVRAEVRP